MICLVYFFLSLSLSLDTESARASRRQLKDAIHAVLFDMNAPAVCALDQVSALDGAIVCVFFLLMLIVHSGHTVFLTLRH